MFKEVEIQSGVHLPVEIAGFRWYGNYAAGTAGIFFSTKQRGHLYRFVGRYGTKFNIMAGPPLCVACY